MAWWIDVATAAAGSVFGLFYCHAWNFRFPECNEQILWDVFSLILLMGPGIYTFVNAILSSS
jgi:hypothetical protein